MLILQFFHTPSFIINFSAQLFLHVQFCMFFKVILPAQRPFLPLSHTTGSPNGHIRKLSSVQQQENRIRQDQQGRSRRAAEMMTFFGKRPKQHCPRTADERINLLNHQERIIKNCGFVMPIHSIDQPQGQTMGLPPPFTPLAFMANDEYLEALLLAVRT
jgi:hypothetical protein